MPDKMPANLEVEQAVLGLMLISSSCMVEGMSNIQEDYFYDKAHQIIFKNMQALFIKGVEVSSISLLEQLRSSGSLSAIGGPSVVADLADSSISSTEFKVLWQILENKASKRRTILMADALMKEAYADTKDTQDFQNFVSERFWESMPQAHQGIQVFGPSNIIEARRDVLRDRHLHEKVEMGWESLDNLIPTGFAPQEISIIASRPSMGKSAFKTNAIKKLCERGLSVVSFATEQSFGIEQDRMEALITGIPLSEIINSGQWEQGDGRVDLIKKAQDTYANWNYHIVPARTIGLADVRNILHQIQQHRPIDVIFFDLFDRLKDVNVANNKAETVHVKLGELSRITQEFNCHGCCLVQVNRQVERRSNKRPMMSDLKSAGAYEEFARLILFLYRESRYYPDSIDRSMEVIIGKQNNGPSDETVRMHFDESTLEVIDEENNFGGI